MYIYISNIHIQKKMFTVYISFQITIVPQLLLVEPSFVG